MVLSLIKTLHRTAPYGLRLFKKYVVIIPALPHTSLDSTDA